MQKNGFWDKRGEGFVCGIFIEARYGFCNGSGRVGTPNRSEKEETKTRVGDVEKLHKTGSTHTNRGQCCFAIAPLPLHIEFNQIIVFFLSKLRSILKLVSEQWPKG